MVMVAMRVVFVVMVVLLLPPLLSLLLSALLPFQHYRLHCLHLIVLYLLLSVCLTEL